MSNLSECLIKIAIPAGGKKQGMWFLKSAWEKQIPHLQRKVWILVLVVFLWNCQMQGTCTEKSVYLVA